MRINKYIAASGFCSRRQADKHVKNGDVTVNGEKAELGTLVSKTDTVKVNGKTLVLQEQDIFLAFNKPIGVISTSDKNADNTVFDFLPSEPRLFYVGRLDVASSGLMLFTNNGDVAETITKSKNNIEKEYNVRVNKSITRGAINALRDGVVVLGEMTKPARVKKITDLRFNIVITEGKNRQIRRMCEALGYEVKALKRIRVANIKLGMLGEGNSRGLTKNEKNGLMELL